MREAIENIISNYPSRYKEGLISSEIEDILTQVKNINLKIKMEIFEDSMNGITCKLIEGKIVYYHHDVFNAIICGVENRGLNYLEFD